MMQRTPFEIFRTQADSTIEKAKTSQTRINTANFGA